MQQVIKFPIIKKYKKVKLRIHRVGTNRKFVRVPPPKTPEELDPKTFKDIKQQIAARMLLMGYEPHTIAELNNIKPKQIREWIRDDPDFRAVLDGLQTEFFSALSNKHEYLLLQALNKLGDLLNHEKAGIQLEAIDRICAIHKKYVQQTEDLTPVSRKMEPVQAIEFLEKGIKYLELTREQKDANTIEVCQIEHKEDKKE